MWPGRPWEFFQNIAPIAVCYLGSVTYHTMMAHHEKYHLWITLDVSINPLDRDIEIMFATLYRLAFGSIPKSMLLFCRFCIAKYPNDGLDGRRCMVSRAQPTV